MKRFRFTIAILVLLVLCLSVRAIVLEGDFLVIEPAGDKYQATVLEMGAEVTADTPQAALDGAVTAIGEYKSAGNERIVEIRAEIAELEAEIARIEEQQSGVRSEKAKIAILVSAALNIANENFELKNNYSDLLHNVESQSKRLLALLEAEKIEETSALAG